MPSPHKSRACLGDGLGFGFCSHGPTSTVVEKTHPDPAMSGREEPPKQKCRRNVKGSCSKQPKNETMEQNQAKRPKNECKVTEEHSNPPESMSVLQEPPEVTKRDPAKYVGNEFLLLSKLDGSLLPCIQHYLGKSVSTGQFYVIKVLTLKDSTDNKKEWQDEIYGKAMTLTEHSLLSLLRNEPGICQEHGLIKETIQQKFVSPEGEVTWTPTRRISLVVECFVQHDHSPSHCKFISLQDHLITEKRLKEEEAIRMFFKMLQIVNRIHELNIVHKDLKLANFIWNRVTEEVKLINFGLGHHLGHEHQQLRDQRGSPAYIPPEIIGGKPYFGKPADMWSLGVIFYTLLNGHFPFHDSDKTKAFQKTMAGLGLSNAVVFTASPRTRALVTSLLDLDWKKRPTASEALQEITEIIAEERAFLRDSDEQVVPASDPHGAKRKAGLIVNYFVRQDLIQENEARLRALINGAEEQEEVQSENQEEERVERTS